MVQGTRAVKKTARPVQKRVRDGRHEFEEAYRAEMKEADAHVWLAILRNKHLVGPDSHAALLRAARGILPPPHPEGDY